MVLRPYQKQGVAFVESREGRALIGDAMGLGKTVQALAWLTIHPELRPAVVVCPTSVKPTWENEINKWMKSPPKVAVLYGEKPEPVSADIIIINYAILANSYDQDENEIKYSGWVDYIKDNKPQVIVIDEVQKIKNTKSYRAKAVRKLCRRVKHVIALSGTPIENGPREFYNILSLLDKTLFTYWRYMQRYCNPKWNGFGWSYKGVSHADELHEKVKTVMIRRKKEEVAKELPEKMSTVIPVHLDDGKSYGLAQADFEQWAKDKGNVRDDEVKNEVAKLKRITWEGKKKQCWDWLNTFLESDEKIIVYAWHKVVLKETAHIFKSKAIRLDGSTSDKRKVAKEFCTNDKIRMLCANYQVVVGMDGFQHACSNVAWLGFPWTPTVLDQANDRVHRLGQESGNVNVWYLPGQNTIETKILDVLDFKRTVFDATVEGKQTKEKSLFSYLTNN